MSGAGHRRELRHRRLSPRVRRSPPSAVFAAVRRRRLGPRTIGVPKTFGFIPGRVTLSDRPPGDRPPRLLVPVPPGEACSGSAEGARRVQPRRHGRRLRPRRKTRARLTLTPRRRRPRLRVRPVSPSGCHDVPPCRASRKGFRPMRSKTADVGLAVLLTAMVGCTLTQQGLRKDEAIPTIGGGGEILGRSGAREGHGRLAALKETRRSSEAVWRAADEQAVDPEVRRVLEANGLRIGRDHRRPAARGPGLLDAPPPNKVEPRRSSCPTATTPSPAGTPPRRQPAA